MEWNVKNALSRDVERQHLNKILAEIRAAIDSATVKQTGPTDDVRSIVGEMVEGNSEQGMSVTYNPALGVLDFAVNDFIIRLTGDVTGQGTVSSLRNVNIPVTLDPSKVGVPEAPIDNHAYWRMNGQWAPVEDSLLELSTLRSEGFLAQSYDDAEGEVLWAVRAFEAASGQLVVTNPTGKDGNPQYGLAEVGDTGVGHSIVDTDEFGRVVGKSPDSFTFTQASPSSTWTINHNLNRKVSAAVYTTGGMQMWADIVVVNDNQLQVLFDGLYNGYVVIH